MSGFMNMDKIATPSDIWQHQDETRDQGQHRTINEETTYFGQLNFAGFILYVLN